MIDLEEDGIDIEAYKKMTKILCPWGTQRVWVGIPTHRLNGLVQSCYFSPPAHIFQMDAYGSKGKHTSFTDNWGQFVGNIDGEHETRSHYWKRYSIVNEPSIKINQLRAQFRMRHVKRPVVHYIYVKRGSPPLYMLWCYTHSFKSNYAISEDNLRLLRNLARDHFEERYFFDVYAVSKIKLSDEDMETAILNAHSWDYIYYHIQRTLMTAHGRPSAHARLEFPEAPRVVTDIVPIRAWSRNTF